MTRVDYLNDPNAPKANNIAVAVSAFVQDEQGHVLMIRRTDNHFYAIPGGQLEPGETLTQAAVREVKEETGIDIEVTGLSWYTRHSSELLPKLRVLITLHCELV